MNKFITTELGGHPLTLNDLGFMQDAYTESIRGILAGLAEPANKGYILYGCELYHNAGTNTWWISEGYTVLKLFHIAEIYYVANHNLGLASLGPNPYWKLQEVDVAPSPVTYKNLNVKNVHKQRRLTVVPTAQTVFFPQYAHTPKWIEVTKNRIWNQSATFPLINNWVPGINPVPNGSYSIEGKRVFMSGDIRYTGSGIPAINLPFTVLPPEVRPASNHMFNCSVTNGWNLSFNYRETMHPTMLKHALVRVQTDGNCYAEPVNVLSGLPAKPDLSILLDGVSWLLP